MKARFLFLFLLSGFVTGTMGQNTIELNFSAVNSTAPVQLDSIKVMNLTQGGDTMLYWPDTILSIFYVGIHENPLNENAFHVYQNYPNPVTDQTTVSLYVPEKDNVSITVTDILGQMIVKSEKVLDKGINSIRFTPCSVNLCFFTARWHGQSSSIKILNTGFHSGGTPTLEYISSKENFPQLKFMNYIQDFSFNFGDELLYIGYADILQSGMIDSPEETKSYILQFATSIPCPGMPTVEYEGQVYNTIQIYSQCWMKESLNVGIMINSSQDQTNNGINEKYCYNNEPDSCTIYGGLYQWNEMMKYTMQQGTQGLCPPGWHVPTEEEWKVLEGSVDSQYRIGNPEWDIWAYRGYDAGTNLKTTSGWNEHGNGTDLYGFSGLPGGGRFYGGEFIYGGFSGGWWTSTDYNEEIAWTRGLDYNNPGSGRLDYDKGNGFSIRCLRDD